MPICRNLWGHTSGHPYILHWKEHFWKGLGMPQTGTYGIVLLGVNCPFIQKRSYCPVPLVTLTGHLTIQLPLLLYSSDGHLLCSNEKAGPREKYSAALYLQIRSIIPLLLNCSWWLGYCVWIISNFQFIVTKDSKLIKVPTVPQGPWHHSVSTCCTACWFHFTP